MLLNATREFLTEDRGVPLIGHLIVVRGAPHLDGDLDPPESTRFEQQARRWSSDHCGLDSRVVNPNQRMRRGAEHIAMLLFDEKTLGGVGMSGA
jgi:hypothetical protein